LINIAGICKAGNRLPANEIRNDIFRMKNIEGLGFSCGITGIDLTNRGSQILYSVGNVRIISFLFIKYDSRQAGDYYAFVDDSPIDSDDIIFRDLGGNLISKTLLNKEDKKITVTENERDFLVNTKIITFSLQPIIAANFILVDSINDSFASPATFSRSEVMYMMQTEQSRKTIVPSYLNNPFSANIDFIKFQQDINLFGQANFFRSGSSNVDKIFFSALKNPFCNTRDYPMQLNYISADNDLTSVSIKEDGITRAVLTHTSSTIASGFLHQVTFQITNNSNFEILFNNGKSDPESIVLLLPNWESKFKDSSNYTNRARLGKLNDVNNNSSYTNFHVNAIHNMATSSFYNFDFFAILTENGGFDKGCYSNTSRLRPVNYSTLFKNKALSTDYFNCDFGR